MTDRSAIGPPDGVPTIRIARGRGGVAAWVDGGILWVQVAGEARGEDLLACIRQSLDDGLLRTGMPTLVDLTGFNGVVDWASIHAIRDLAPWGGAPAPRIAYVARDTWMSMLLKIIRTLFPRARHRLFLGHIAALAWLRGEAR